MESCAACGKTDGSLKSCAACKLVKYCGANCQVAHRSEHKHACRKRAAELFDEKLFTQPQRSEDCVICSITLPFDEKEINYMLCCGKSICNGCRFCLPREHCPFCNMAVHRSDEEGNKSLFERVDKYNDPEAIYQLGVQYDNGTNGFSVDRVKAVEFYQRACDLGLSGAHCNLGYAHEHGQGVLANKNKAFHHYQMGALSGNVNARFSLGLLEGRDGNLDRAVRHFIIAAKCGDDESLELVKKGYMKGNVTKEDFEKTLRGYKAYVDEIKSEQRDRAREMIGSQT
eukprot:scaffold89254_cov22-Cyclotella_meneghiniana.AAC.1